MILTLIPQFGADGDAETALSVAGDVLTINGTPYDLPPIPEGGEGWPEGDTPFIAPIRRIDGVIHATVIVHLDSTAAQDQPAAPWTVTVTDGPVTIPAVRIPQEAEE